MASDQQVMGPKWTWFSTVGVKIYTTCKALRKTEKKKDNHWHAFSNWRQKTKRCWKDFMFNEGFWEIV